MAESMWKTQSLKRKEPGSGSDGDPNDEMEGVMRVGRYVLSEGIDTGDTKGIEGIVEREREMRIDRCDTS